MLCTHKDSKGTNEVVMRGACEYISEELLHIPTDNKELFIKDILHQLSGTYYRLLEPIFKDKKRYAKVYNLLIDDNDHKEKQSYEFVNWAYQNYQSFISFLYGICEKHNIDLDSLQDDNDLRITPYKRSKPKSTSITKKKTTTLSSDERAKKIERVVQNLDDIFNVATKRKYDKLTTDLAKYAIDRCKTGKDIYALATFLYRCKNITIVSKPNTITKWINVFKSACENDLQTDNYKPNKVNSLIKEVMKYFTYLQI
jgi:glycerol-3-phosphate cytidylyltransferase-like family protein